MWIIYLFLVYGFSASTCWIHDGKVVGFDLVRKSVLPVHYFYVQLVDVYGRK